LAVVLKVLTPAANRQRPPSRFIRVHLLSRIEHPHAIRIYDQGFTDTMPTSGWTSKTATCARKSPPAGLSQRRALDITGQVAKALMAIHANIIHRDLAGEHHARPTGAAPDFGIHGRSSGGKPRLDSPATAASAPYYLSPEQAGGDRSRRSPTCTSA
jgi:hypothetical protein